MRGMRRLRSLKGSAWRSNSDKVNAIVAAFNTRVTTLQAQELDAGVAFVQALHESGMDIRTAWARHLIAGRLERLAEKRNELVSRAHEVEVELLGSIAEDRQACAQTREVFTPLAEPPPVPVPPTQVKPRGVVDDMLQQRIQQEALTYRGDNRTGCIPRF